MYYILYGFLYLISLLPSFLLYGLSDLVAFILYRVAGYRKAIVEGNLAIAFPEKTEAERKVIASKFYRNLTDTFIESIQMLSMSDARIQKRATINGEAVRALEASGKNIQYHSGHQMNWEYGNYAVAKNSGIPFIAIYMRIKNKAVDRLFVKLRSRPGSVMIAAQDFKSRMHNVFNNQYAIGLVADQNPGVPSNAYWLNFFGRPTPFVTGPDKGARRNKVAVVFVKFTKIKRGYYHFHQEVITDDASSWTEGMLTRRYRDFLEQAIREQPENYLWSHRRWKWGWDNSYARRWIDEKKTPLQEPEVM